MPVTVLINTTKRLKRECTAPHNCSGVEVFLGPTASRTFFHWLGPALP